MMNTPFSATDYESMLAQIQSDSRYQTNIHWGKPRRGHPEGTILGHIQELEQNLKSLQHKLTDLEIAQLRVLIHTHDSFKPESQSGVPITHPRSHASLARSFLAEYCNDLELLTIVQYHDEPYALWRNWKSKGTIHSERMSHLESVISEWTLFPAFLIIDGCTDGKSPEPVQWYLSQVLDRVDSRITVDDIL